MSFFKQPKPRKFHHEPIYYDEHRDRVRQIEEKARRELGIEPKEHFSAENIRGAFSNSSRRLTGNRRGLGRMAVLANSSALVVIIIILLLVWIYLS